MPARDRLAICGCAVLANALFGCSVEGARRNLEAELAALDLEALRADLSVEHAGLVAGGVLLMTMDNSPSPSW